MYSPLCFGSGALSLWGHSSCKNLQRPPCATRTRAGRPLQQEGTFHSPSEGSVLQQKEHSGLLDRLSSLSCSFSGANGAQGSPKRWAGCQPHATPSLVQVVFPVLEPGEEAAEGSPGLPPGVPVGAADAGAPTGSPRTSTCVLISPAPM